MFSDQILGIERGVHVEIEDYGKINALVYFRKLLDTPLNPVGS